MIHLQKNWAWSNNYNAGVPVINYTALISKKITIYKSEESKLLDSLEFVGFFVLTNHKIDKTLMNQIWNIARSFFDSNLNNKLAVQMNDEYMYGYTAAEILSRSETKEGYGLNPDDKESFNVMIGADGKHYESQYQAKWPPYPLNMKTIYTKYYRQLEKIVSNILTVISRNLHLPIHFFEGKINNHLSCIRTINYPPQEKFVKKGTLRCSPHTDYGTFTLLWQDDIGGLQIEKTQGTNDWIDVKTKPYDFSVNIGDLLSRWTNNKFRSTRHQVINAKILGIQNRRQTIVFFHNLNADAIVETIPSCLVNGKSEYSSTTFTNYLKSKHHATQIYNKTGKSEI